jgi:hypothetical protein
MTFDELLSIVVLLQTLSSLALCCVLVRMYRAQERHVRAMQAQIDAWREAPSDPPLTREEFDA